MRVRVVPDVDFLGVDLVHLLLLVIELFLPLKISHFCLDLFDLSEMELVSVAAHEVLIQQFHLFLLLQGMDNCFLNNLVTKVRCEFENGPTWIFFVAYMNANLSCLSDKILFL